MKRRRRICRCSGVYYEDLLGDFDKEKAVCVQSYDDSIFLSIYETSHNEFGQHETFFKEIKIKFCPECGGRIKKQKQEEIWR
jgi:uncharacterized protein with PIN domain